MMKKLWEDQIGDKLDEIAAASVETSKAIHINRMKVNAEVKEASLKFQSTFS